MSAALAQNWWVLALRGAAALAFGLIALLTPGIAILSLVIFFAAYLLIDGVLTCLASVRAMRHHERWILLLAEGIADIVMAGLAMLFPVAAIFAFILLIAAWAIVSGLLLLISSFRLHADHGRVWMALSGSISIVWGVMLAIAPFIGAIVLAWWLGLYAVFFGVMMCILAWRLHHHAATPLPGNLKAA
jgi:uncharacterized membrane protein HdeD (DUF308 family)